MRTDRPLTENSGVFSEPFFPADVLVRLLDGLEPLLGNLDEFGAEVGHLVGVVFQGELAVGGLDLVDAGARRDPEYLPGPARVTS